MGPGLITELAFSVLGAAIVVVVTWLFGALKSARVTPQAASDRLAFDEPDFAAGEWMIGADGKSAAVVSADARETAVVFVLGDGLGTRRFRRGAVSLERDGAELTFRINEPSLGAVSIMARNDAEAEQWVLRLAGARL
ncbi:MAG: hypothetical protein KDD85_06175 [Parvularculaceae bacterium]|nr:hypothetical protein [Parvularculaceae bacterium]